jgi:hypothetical protein
MKKRSEKVDAAGPVTLLPAAGAAGPGLWYGLGILSVVALAVRLYAASDNFWLDEIFTYYLARERVHSLIDVFTGIRVEHQFLVTLGMYLLGDHLNWVWYRLPSVITGTGTLALMALIGHRRMGRAALIVTMAVAALSYPLVVYSSEARGYAPATFFSLAMFALLEAYWRRRNVAFLFGFWTASVVAVLYHPAAICISLALGSWSFVRECRVGGGLPRVVREWAFGHAIPFAFFAWLYLAIMRHWASAGGDVVPLARVLGDTMAVAIGLPMRAPFRWWALALGSVLIVSSLWILARRIRSEVWTFYLSALLLAPALMLLIGSRSFVYVRYFVILFPFYYLMLGEALDAVARRSKGARLVVAGLCAVMLVGNTVSTVEFLRVGRGGYLKAVTYMAANTPWPNVTVGGDQDFRNGYPVAFYRRYLPKGRNMVYLTSGEWPPEGPDWFLMHNTCSEEDFVPQDVVGVRGRNYRLVKTYPVLGLSGVAWHLYRNDSKFDQ